MPAEMAKGPDPPSGPWPLALALPPGVKNGTRCALQPSCKHGSAQSATNRVKNSYPNSAVRSRFDGGRPEVMQEARLEPYELPGEDLTTSVLPEVAGWISIYEELASVLRSILARADGSGETGELRKNLGWIETRLATCRDRHAQLAGVAIDPKAP